MFSKVKLLPLKLIIPVFYSAAILLMIIIQWTNQSGIRHGSGGPLYYNLMNGPAFARRGFDQNDISRIPAEGGAWVRFKSHPFVITNSGLPDLPKRAYLSPFRTPDEEFTIIIQLDINSKTINYIENNPSAFPGIYFSIIGENWEIFLNGHLIQSQMHLDENGRIKSRRTWRDVHFPIDKNLFTPGTNVLALHIAGDPTYDAVGLYYAEPYYIDDYYLIKDQHESYLLFFICGVLAYTGIYYLLIFLSVRKKEEIFNLYYGIFSILLCIYFVTTKGAVYLLIPSSDITTRAEYMGMFLSISMLCIFVEHMGRQSVSKISWYFLGFSAFLGVTQIFFSCQYGDEVMHIFLVTMLIYFTYIFFNIVRIYFKNLRIGNGENAGKEKISNTFFSILIGSLIVFACGIHDILDVIVFRNSFRLFVYSTFVFHVGMALTLSSRFSGIYRQLEKSNVVLEKTVHERTLELEEQTRIAVQASQAKSQFLATMSHEIRTPLNAVIGLSEIELQRRLPEADISNIRQIYQSGSTLLGIINDILDISKIEAGGFELVNTEYETACMINDTVIFNRVRIASKKIDFILKINGDFPKKLVGDELRIKQILNNIISNAIKYTDEGSVTLSATWGNVYVNDSDKKAWLRFAVSDTGRGIRRSDVDKLFTNYSQFDTKANRKIEGTGLGLAISKKLADMMNGNIMVESEYGRGSTFTVEVIQDFTKKTESIGEETADKLRRFLYVSPWKGKDISHVSLAEGKVLVVDDMPVNIQVVKGLLEPYKLMVDTASSGYEAIDMIAYGKKFDLIFMDHMMPGMDGIETAAVIKKKDSSIPIVALTANAVVGMREMFLENGFNDYLSKPIDIIKLDEIIKRWVGDKISPAAQEGQGGTAPEIASVEDKSGEPETAPVETKSEKSETAPAETKSGEPEAKKERPSIISIPNVDTEAGIKGTGGTSEIYFLVLSAFYKDARNRIELIKNEMDESKPVSKDFTIHVHALKSAMASIGAMDLSAKAAALEKAGRSGADVFIRQNLPDFIEQLIELNNNIGIAIDSPA